MLIVSGWNIEASRIVTGKKTKNASAARCSGFR